MGYLFNNRTDGDVPRFDRGDLTSGRGEQPFEMFGEGGVAHYAGIPAFGLLRHTSRAAPEREAIRYEDLSWTYAELNHDAVRSAAMFQALGVRPGDRIGILLPNVPEYAIALHGVWRAGAIGVAISPLMVRDEVDSLLKATGCRFVVCLDMLSHLVPTGSGTRRLLVSIRDRLPAIEQLGYLWMRHRRTGRWSLPTGDENLWFWEQMEAARREWQPVAIHPARDPAYILPTGGTTGRPKAVTLSHQNIVANAWQQAEWTRRSFAEETMMAVLPFFHSYGLSAVMMGGMAMGATLVLQHRFQARQLIRQIETLRPTVLHAVPAMLVALNERLRERPADLRSLKWVISGGAPLDETVAAEFSRHSGALVVEGYGLSEASPVTHVGPLFGGPSYGTIGLALPETECRIADIETGTQVVPRGETGELCVRGPQVMLGYWNDPDATDEVIRGGWLFTGDLATRGDDGMYRIVGRKKDLIITSGFNVYPSEVEEVLVQADGVRDAAVVGVRDPRCGELVKAFIVLEPGTTWDEEALRAFCRERLAKHKRPRLYERSAEDLPRNFLGKVVRRHLRESPPAPHGPAPETAAAESAATGNGHASTGNAQAVPASGAEPLSTTEETA